VVAHGRVVQPDPASEVAIISDIDDTILHTGMTEGLRSIQRTLLRDAHGRKPIPGMPSLYRGLAHGSGSRPESTVFYMSNRCRMGTVNDNVLHTVLCLICGLKGSGTRIFKKFDEGRSSWPVCSR